MPKHILVVDDSKEVADTKVWVIRKLSGEEFTAEAVYGGRECLERLAVPPKVDLIMLDMDMPEVNGADIIKTFLQMEYPPAKVLPMTAWGPDWIGHWNLSELAHTAAFRRWVWPATYDKATDAEEMMDLIRQATRDIRGTGFPLTTRGNDERMG